MHKGHVVVVNPSRYSVDEAIYEIYVMFLKVQIQPLERGCQLIAGNSAYAGKEINPKALKFLERYATC